MNKKNNYYYIKFSSIKSNNEYSIYINKNNGYYKIESLQGVIKYEGHLITDVRNCNFIKLNNFIYNIINEFLNI